VLNPVLAKVVYQTFGSINLPGGYFSIFHHSHRFPSVRNSWKILDLDFTLFIIMVKENLYYQAESLKSWTKR